MLDRLKTAFKAGTQAYRTSTDSRMFNDKIFYKMLGGNYLFGNYNKTSGIDKGFNYNTNVYAIINRIAQVASDIPIYITKENSQNEQEEVTDGDFYDLVFNPNELQNYKSLTYAALVYQLANGNIFEHFITPSTFKAPRERYVLGSQYIDIKAKEVFYGFEAEKYVYQFADKTYKFDVDEIIHVKKFNPDISQDSPCYGLSPLTAAYRTLEASNEILTSEASVIKNRGMMGMLTSKANRALTDDEKNWAQDALKKRIGGGEKFGQIGVTSGNMEYISFAMSPSDLKILESGEMKLRELCSVYGVSSRQFNDPNGATFNNVKEDEKKFYSNAILPPLQLYIDSINRRYSKLFKEETGIKYKINIDLESIRALQEDDAKLAIKQRSTSETVARILTGISEGKWSIESAKNQLIFSLQITEEEANELLIGIKEPTNNNSNEQ